MADHDPPVTEVLKSAITNAQELIRSEFSLAKAELREEVRRLGAGVVMLAVAGVAGLIGLVFLLTAAAWALSERLGWPIWTGFAVVAAVLLAVAAVMGLVGRSRMTRERRMPRTLDTMKENMEWMRARTS